MERGEADQKLDIGVLWVELAGPPLPQERLGVHAQAMLNLVLERLARLFGGATERENLRFYYSFQWPPQRINQKRRRLVFNYAKTLAEEVTSDGYLPGGVIGQRLPAQHRLQRCRAFGW